MRPNPMSPTPPAAELYAACRAADLIARTAAYETLWRYLYQVALHVLHDQSEAEALAQDCAQMALLYIHKRLADVREPGALLVWARRVASHAAIDELRRRRRLVPLIEGESDDPPARPQSPAAIHGSFEGRVLDQISLEELRDIISHAPISDRSRRAVLGRYLDDLPDESLAQNESGIAGRPVLPSHVQVTRAKDIAKLRDCEPLRRLLQREE